MDFWISKWISGFQLGFLDFWISVWISADGVRDFFRDGPLGCYPNLQPEFSTEAPHMRPCSLCHIVALLQKLGALLK